MFTHIDSFPQLDLPTTTIKGQRWYQTPQNNYYPSITTVLGSDEKPWLADWRKMLGEKKADKETKRCADRGTAVHLMVEQFLKNAENSTSGQTLDNIKLFNQLKFALKRINNIRGQEIALYSDALEVAGRCDCIAEWDGVLSIIDFKTSTSIKTESMIENYFLQTTAYAAMCNEMYKTNIENVVILIATEKSMLPLIFEKKTHEYVTPLSNYINTFYTKL